jgi:alkylation response protein AidB-like acyl-CoA dehydrogenase
MNFGLNEEQTLLRDAFARFFDSESSMARVRRANAAGGFDRDLWLGLAKLGTFGIRA